MTAYYNENDKRAAAWLRELIRWGHIAPGDVDERSILDVVPSDLRGYTQCHFFAGIGVWSYALRLAGWPDDRPVWTGSCPCQPFSAAGKGAGFDDERHLWPAWHHLIDQRRPGVVLGEQVASKDGLAWLDLVHADMEATGYAFGAFDLCAAGVGAPHIRQRLWFVGTVDDGRSGRHAGTVHGAQGRVERGVWGVTDRVESAGDFSGLAHNGLHLGGREAPTPNHLRPQADRPSDQPGGCSGAPSGLANVHGSVAGLGRGAGSESGPGVQSGPVADGRSGACLVADSSSSTGLPTRQRGALVRTGRGCEGRTVEQRGGSPDAKPPAGTRHSPWADPDWLFCRDGRWRPVEAGTFPLAHGAPARVGLLRGYGNAIVAEVAATFIQSYLEWERQ